VGYVAEFGLLSLPLWLLVREALARGVRVSREVGAVALMLAFNLADLLPNATIIPLTWLMAGALFGHVEGLRRARRESRRRPRGAAVPAPAGRAGPVAPAGSPVIGRVMVDNPRMRMLSLGRRCGTGPAGKGAL